jgi:flagellar motor switch protein FliM
LLRHVDQDAEYQRPAAENGREHIKHLLMDSSFGLELCLPDLMVPAPALADLSVGQVLPLDCDMHALATVFVEGIPLFAATAARSGSYRAAHIAQVRAVGKRGGNNES